MAHPLFERSFLAFFDRFYNLFPHVPFTFCTSIDVTSRSSLFFSAGDSKGPFIGVTLLFFRGFADLWLFLLVALFWLRGLYGYIVGRFFLPP